MEPKNKKPYIILPNIADQGERSNSNAASSDLPKKNKPTGGGKLFDASAKATAKKWQTLQEMAKDPNQNFVLLIGKSGAAKTVITATLNYAAAVTYGADKGVVDAWQGVKYLNTIIKELSAGKFPHYTLPGYMEFYKTTVFFKNQHLPLTYIEMAGEDFHRLDATEDRNSSPAINQLTDFLKLKPNMVIFLVAPATEAEQHDWFFHDCVCRFHTIHSELVNNMGVIMSKWDLLPPSQRDQSAKKLFSKKMPATYAWLSKRSEVKLTGYFPFSVGKVTLNETENANDNPFRLESGISTTYAKSILKWIKKILADAPKNQALESLKEKLAEAEQISDASGERLEKLGRQIEDLVPTPPDKEDFYARLKKSFSWLL